MVASIRMIAKVPTLAAMAYKYHVGQPFMYPTNDLDYASNFLRMCFAVPTENFHANPVLARAMDRIFILHADHEQNASTSTVRLAGSSGANPFACIAAGCACLWGPAHGGANEAALNMLSEIGCVDRIPEFIKRAKDKNDPFRLMGFGHRVYKNYDPRAKIMQKTCHEVLAELGIKDDPLLDVAMELEKIALHDDYFVEKKLYPNIDFYSGITLKAMGFPTTMFTVLFAVARTVGWIAQWKEMIEDPKQKIGRPRQLYTGAQRAITCRFHGESKKPQGATYSRTATNTPGRSTPFLSAAAVMLAPVPAAFAGTLCLHAPANQASIRTISRSFHMPFREEPSCSRSLFVPRHSAPALVPLPRLAAAGTVTESLRPGARPPPSPISAAARYSPIEQQQDGHQHRDRRSTPIYSTERARASTCRK